MHQYGKKHPNRIETIRDKNHSLKELKDENKYLTSLLKTHYPDLSWTAYLYKLFDFNKKNQKFIIYNNLKLTENLYASDYKQIIDLSVNETLTPELEQDITESIERLSKPEFVHNLFEKEYLPISYSSITNGYYNFNNLYEERQMLTAALFNLYPDNTWKTITHSDGEVWDGLFLVGVTVPGVGDYTYHYSLNYWNRFRITELDIAPPYDGHTTKDIKRLNYLKKNKGKK